MADNRTKQVFTTGEVAQVCKVSQQTVIRCFDSGRLKGFRVPGSRFRRIPRESLLSFMKMRAVWDETVTKVSRRRTRKADRYGSLAARTWVISSSIPFFISGHLFDDRSSSSRMMKLTLPLEFSAR